MQKRIAPSFFGTNTTGADHGLFDFEQKPEANISSVNFSTISLFLGEILLGAVMNDVWPIFPSLDPMFDALSASWKHIVGAKHC